MRTRVLLASLLAPALLLSGCGGGTDGAAEAPGGPGSSTAGSSTAGSPSAAASSAPVDPTTPAEPTPAEPTRTPAPTLACDDVWQEGAKLPGRYKGCLADDGRLVRARKRLCSSGQTFVVYGEHHWAVRGGRIHEVAGSLSDDPDFRASIASCLG